MFIFKIHSGQYREWIVYDYLNRNFSRSIIKTKNKRKKQNSKMESFFAYQQCFELTETAMLEHEEMRSGKVADCQSPVKKNKIMPTATLKGKFQKQPSFSEALRLAQADASAMLIRFPLWEPVTYWEPETVSHETTT